MDYGPFPDFEDGRHVRCGYNRSMLSELCERAGLKIEEFSLISGPISQLGAWLLWKCRAIHPIVGWIVILPLRPLAPLLDPALVRWFGTTPFCIGIEAYKPRVPQPASESISKPASEPATVATADLMSIA